MAANLTPREALAEDHRQALELTQKVGIERVRKVLAAAAADLERRILEAVHLRGLDDSTFTITQMRATLAQVREATKVAQRGIAKTVVETGAEAAEAGARGTLEYLRAAERDFRGVAAPLQLEEAGIVDQAQSGVKASILRRLASSGEAIEGADEQAHPAKPGVLERYGAETIGHFERVLQKGFLTRKPWGEVRDELTEQSPFLQASPAFWAERIVRSETMSAMNRAGYEVTRAADDELGDMVKILSAHFDDRTAADSYATHGQIRRPQEPFQSWYGLMQHPPDRPNDRGVVVPHRISWPIPPALAWKTDGEVAARWKYDGRKGAVPPRPKMTTIPLEQFGKGKEEPKAAAAVVPAALEERPDHLLPGVHFKNFTQKRLPRGGGDVDVSTVFDTALPHRGVLDHLETNPIDELVAVPEIKQRGKRPNGLHTQHYTTNAEGERRVLKTRIDIRAHRVVDANPYEPGVSWSISSLGKSAEEAIALTLAHEIGHHVHLSGGSEVNAIVQTAFQKAKSDKSHLTRYGSVHKDEYFAESFAAHMRKPNLLASFDPIGHQMVQDVFKKLGIGKR